jgi:hypothetical protein
MKTEQTIHETIDEYIADFPPDVQVILKMLRATIRKAAPDAEEAMSTGYRLSFYTVTWCILCIQETYRVLRNSDGEREVPEGAVCLRRGEGLG